MARPKVKVEEVEVIAPKEVVTKTELTQKQKEYLATLEVYKAQNPVKYEAKKDILLAKLNDIK